MIDHHNEIEAKLDAPHVSDKQFRDFMSDQEVTRYERIISPDGYWESGSNVVRQRGEDSGHELTVKRRKSAGSTRDREEIDLFFSQRTTNKDVEAFLRATGFTLAFTLRKDSRIYWVQLTPSLEASFVLYDVWKDQETKPRRFIEVEAEKGSNVTVETAKRHVQQQVKALQGAFGLGEPLNDSLYEIYSGRKYLSV